IYKVDEEESYDFPAADEETVNTLSNSYRVIRLLANGSPALAVSFYGAGFYSQQSLSELKPLVQQIVSLNLSGMPVDKKDLEMLKSFSNLRKINLNNTPFDDEGIALLNAVSTLKSVNLNGTGVTVEGAKALLAKEAIQKIYI